MWQSKNRRSSIEIVADILRLLRLGDASKIEIACTSKIHGEQASKYLERLLEAGVLEHSQDKMELPGYRIILYRVYRYRNRPDVPQDYRFTGLDQITREKLIPLIGLVIDRKRDRFIGRAFRDRDLRR